MEMLNSDDAAIFDSDGTIWVFTPSASGTKAARDLSIDIGGGQVQAVAVDDAHGFAYLSISSDAGGGNTAVLLAVARKDVTGAGAPS